MLEKLKVITRLLDEVMILPVTRFRFRYSFICQCTLTRRQQCDLFGRQVKLPPVITV